MGIMIMIIIIIKNNNVTAWLVFLFQHVDHTGISYFFVDVIVSVISLFCPSE